METKFTEVVTIDQVNNGAVSDLFEMEFKKILNNLADENTSWKTQREVSIKVKVKLSDDTRSTAITMVEVTAKTAPPKPNMAIVHLDTDGENVAAFTRHEPDQPELDNVINIKEAK